MTDVIAASLVLAAVLFVGAVGKLVDRERSRDSIVAFGVSDQLAGPLGWLLIATELAIAAALLAARSRAAGAVAALTLLVILTAAVVVNVIGGRTPECQCFGRLSAGRIGWPTVARNGMLASIAAFVATGGREPGVFVVSGLVFGGLWMAYGPLRQKLRSGSAALGFGLADETGERWTLERLLATGQPVLLVFTQPGCAACLALLPDLQEWQSRLGDRLTVAVVSQGSGRAGSAPTIRQTAFPTLSDPEGSVASAYGVTATPSAALIEPDGRAASGLALGAGEIAELVRTRFLAEDASRFPRRIAIARAARGAATLGAFPLLAAACGSSKSSSQSTRSSTTAAAATSGRPAALHIDKQYICQQTYALCTNAPCVPSPHDPNIVICDCVVKPGYSIGFIPCPKRAPHGKTVYSEFSTALVTSGSRAMTCPENVPWANCVDSICELDPTDPHKARCRCPLVKTGPSFTFGGDCNTKTCGKTVWSGAHSGLGGSQVAAAMKRVGQPLVYPAPCPKS